jgi:hypothetical protein
MGFHSCNGIHHLSSNAQAVLAEEMLASRDHDAAAGTSRRGGILRIMMPGGRGMGGFDGSLQRILTEMSGLKKPRGFLTRRLRQFLNIQPK